jgi:hypothetical protein
MGEMDSKLEDERKNAKNKRKQKKEKPELKKTDFPVLCKNNIPCFSSQE